MTGGTTPICIVLWTCRIIKTPTQQSWGGINTPGKARHGTARPPDHIQDISRVRRQVAEAFPHGRVGEAARPLAHHTFDMKCWRATQKPIIFCHPLVGVLLMIGSARKGRNLVDTAWMHFLIQITWSELVYLSLCKCRINIKVDVGKATLLSVERQQSVLSEYQETLEAFIMTCTHPWGVTETQDYLFWSLVY